MKHIIRLFILIAALALGTDHAWAEVNDNPRVNFVYVDGDNYALTSDKGVAIASDEAAGQVTITVTINEGKDFRCIEGDLTAEQSINSGMGQARRRTSAEGPGNGVSVPVTCRNTNKFTLTLPDDESTNVTVYVKFSEKLEFTPEVTIEDWTYGDEAKTPTITGNTSGGDVTYTYFFKDGDVTYFEPNPQNAGTYFVKATVAATADYKECESAPFEFTINRAPLTVTAKDHGIFYGNAAANNGVTYNGFVNGETESVLGGTLTYTYSNNKGPYGEGNDTPGDYVITPDGLTSNNYEITFEPGTLYVYPAHVPVRVVDKADGKGIETASVTVQVLDNGNQVTVCHIGWCADINDLKTGVTYTLRETVAPEGYVLPSDLTFTIDNEGKVTSSGSTTTDEFGNTVLLLENSKTHVEISVVDITTKAPISGATIQVLDGNGNVVKDLEDNNVEWTSDGSTHTIEGLTTNVEYTLRETAAPNRYAAPADYKFTIAPDGSITFTGNKTENGVLLVENTKTGDLRVSNTVYSDLASDANQEFTFTVTAALNDQPISGTYGEGEGCMTFENGVASFTLKGGQEKTAANLLYGTTYTVTQEDAEGFTLEKTEVKGTIGNEASTATFKYIKLIDVSVAIIWNDANNQDGKRPSEVSVILKANDEQVGSKVLNNGNEWRYTFKNQPSYTQEGTRIVYSWEMPATLDYISEPTVDGHNTTLTLTYESELHGFIGYCGKDNSETTDVDESKNVTWSIPVDDPATEDIDESKTITISGTGYMMYYNSIKNADQTWSNGAPWKAFAGQIEAVVIEKGITYVGSNTFAHCPNIKSVTLPAEGIYEIGPGAFAYCTSLTSIDIPMSVNNIGDGAFAGCSKLATVSIGYGEATSFTIGTDVFPATTTILVCETALSGYQTAAGWSTYQIAPATRTLFAADATNKWMTWCDKYDYVKPDGVTVYTVSGVENNTVTLEEVSVIPAYTPVLLYREAAGVDAVTATFSAVGTAPASGYDSSSGIVEANLSDNVTLYGNSGNGAYDSGSDNNIFAVSENSAIQSYVLLDGQFVLVDNDEGISAHRCWLNVEKSTTNGARLLSINTDSESTGIETTNFTNSANSSGAWYGIDGRKLDGKPTKKGLYIYNGKKQVIK